MKEQKKKRKKFFTLKNKRQLPSVVTKLLYVLVKMLSWTYRPRYKDEAELLTNPDLQPVIYILWHNRILFMPGFFPRELRESAAVLISASRDGQYAADFIEKFDLQVVRGSSSRGGHGALRQLRQKLKNNLSVIITLDGPRGPKYDVQPGAMALAYLSKRPIVPVSLNAKSRWNLKSWDGTQIPKPFSSIELVVGKPLMPADAFDLSHREELKKILRTHLMSITED